MQRPGLLWVVAPLFVGVGVICLVLGVWAGLRLAGGAGALSVYTAAAGGMVLVSAAGALLVARRLGAPLGHIRDAVERLAGGDLASRTPAPDIRELEELARALNTLAASQAEHLRGTSRRAEELGTVLSHMAEAVLAVDAEERVLNLNPAAARLFNVGLDGARGRYLLEVVRNAELGRFVARTLSSATPTEGEIAIRRGHGDVFLMGHGTTLRDEGGAIAGAVTVFHDVTALRRMETMRKDFVANVSHELKTPITSIKGFVETLLDRPPDDAEESRRYLSIVARQADRMMAIVDDLLALSRIEQVEGREGIALATAPLEPLLRAALQPCEKAAGERQVALELDCDEHLSAAINAPLLEQAVVNLVENAVAHSPERGVVRLEAEAAADGVFIRVHDRGPGIDSRFHQRVFERFFRVDAARSRARGGTGLGLAIVKHIAQAHGGQAWVRSRPGEGSIFTIHLPARAEAPSPAAHSATGD